MKKIIGILTLLLAVLLSAQAQSIEAVNYMGATKVDLQPGGAFHLVSCNFETGETNTLLSIFDTNQLTQSIFLGGCDTVSLWNPQTSTYQRWAQYTDGKFYKANDGTEWASKIEGNPSVPVGTSFWIASAAGSSETNSLIFSGDVISNPTQNVSIVSGYQMISFPFSQEVQMNSTALFESGASGSLFLGGADRISIWQGDSYQRYALYTDGKWYKANDGDEWASKILATNIIKISEGVWYESISDFTWSETNRYSQIF